MTTAPIKILLVEDSPSDAELLQEILQDLEGHAFVFRHAETLDEGLKLLAAEDFDILLLDLSLPDSAGTGTFQRARAAAPHLPIVVLTGMDSEELGIAAVRQGVQDYLIKGQSDGRVLARSIRYAIERMQVEEALRHSEELLAQQAKHLEKLVRERTAKLEETVAELEHFSYSITHDMRAPLRAMQGFAQILLREECTQCKSANAREFLQRIATAADRMDHLIQDALQFSKVVRTEYPLSPIDLAEFLQGMLKDYPNLQPPKVKIALEGDFPIVLGNEAGLTQCFSNLLNNAAKFVAPGVTPHVRIWAEEMQPGKAIPQHASRKPQFIRIWIEDNGIGIPKDAQKKIFGMFQQINKTYEGTGIGLALVRKAAERMGGKVDVQSELGKGSRFWLDLQKAP